MKATLTFDLSDPDEREEHMRCVKATNAYIALLDIKDAIRSHLKHNPDKLNEKTVEHISEQFWDILDDNNINIDAELT